MMFISINTGGKALDNLETQLGNKPTTSYRPATDPEIVGTNEITSIIWQSHMLSRYVRRMRWKCGNRSPR